MAHEGRRIYTEWFDALLAGYSESFGDEPLAPISSFTDMKNQTEELLYRIQRVNRGDEAPEASEDILKRHLGFISVYTSAASLNQPENLTHIDLTRVNDSGLRKHTEDAIGFFIKLPPFIAYDAIKESGLVDDQTERLALVHEALQNSSFVDCLNSLGRTGFAVLTSPFAAYMGGLLSGRENRRTILNASPKDPELITVQELTDGSHRYELSTWARQTLAERLSDQNSHWPKPNYGKGNMMNSAGPLINLPAPISSGCPIKDFRPLCDFLASTLPLPVRQHAIIEG